MFSKACEYGIRALTVIAHETQKGNRVGIKEICNKAQTPESFTAKILQNLVKRDVINSQKGPSGGFFIARSLNKISLYEIVDAIDGPGIFNKCGLGLSECNAKKPCPLHKKFEAVRSELHQMCIDSDLESLIAGLNMKVYKR